MNGVLLFLSTFVLIFSMGLQSQMVNHGNYVGAFINSAVISFSQLLVLRLAPDAPLLDLTGYLLGGPIGIVASMYVHRRFFRRPRNG